jgi:hypothetical protein
LALAHSSLFDIWTGQNICNILVLLGMQTAYFWLWIPVRLVQLANVVGMQIDKNVLRVL